MSTTTNSVLLVASDKKSQRRVRPKMKNFGDRVFFGILRGAAIIPIAMMILFIGVLIVGAWPAMKQFGFAFLYTSVWEPNSEVGEQFGALPFIYGTLFTSIMALCIAGPIGIGVAAFLNEVLSSRYRSIFAFLIEILATIPSIVYGIWAFFVLRVWVRDAIQPVVQHLFGRDFVLFRGPPMGLGLLSGTLILAVMILPLIVSISLDALRMVPNSYREAALGLGATRWEMILMAVLPPAKSGLIGACILALGRALGETMAITMVIGNQPEIRWSLFQSATTISAVIATKFTNAQADSEILLPTLTELALILFVLTLFVNIIARMIIRRFAGEKAVLV